MTDAGGTAGTETLRGRNRISSRAIRAVVSAVAAEALDTVPKTVGVELGDDNGALAVTAIAPIGITSLRAIAGRADASSAVPTVLERAAAAQNSIRDRVFDLTGSTIRAVNIRLTSARIEGDERVR